MEKIRVNRASDAKGDCTQEDEGVAVLLSTENRSFSGNYMEKNACTIHMNGNRRRYL